MQRFFKINQITEQGLLYYSIFTQIKPHFSKLHSKTFKKKISYHTVIRKGLQTAQQYTNKTHLHKKKT